MHVHRLRHYQKTGLCEFCGNKGRTDWSNKSGEYRSADDIFDWQELCRSCHKTYDTKQKPLKFKKPRAISLASLRLETINKRKRLFIEIDNEIRIISKDETLYLY